MDIDFLIERVHRLLLDNLPVKTSKTPSGWVTMNCPMCNDKRKRESTFNKKIKKCILLSYLEYLHGIGYVCFITAKL